MAARSFGITVQNLSGAEFTLVGKHLDHGEWSDTPPDNLPEVHLDGDGDAVAGNSFSASSPKSFKASWGNISGSNANVTVVIARWNLQGGQGAGAAA
jgi:hypothetical protein